MSSDPTENLFKAIDERRDELVELTRAFRDCIAYGPGILDLAHQPDEYVVIEDMVNSAKVMALAARSLLYGTA
jgi:acetylornithine deacetylase/succinyl-diaminopimelate desuccinylase-like protein